MASAFNKRPDPSVLEKVLEEENPSRTFCVERRLSWKAPPQFSGPGEGDVSETTLFPEGESSQADVSKEQERGASSGADTAETHAYGLSPLRLGKGNRSASPVSVRTRVKLWEVKAGKGASSRGALIGTLPEVGAAELTERHEPAPEQSERNEAVTEVSGAYGKTGKRDQREPMSDLEKDSDGYETKQMMEERGLVASMAAGSQADVSKEGDDVSKRATPQNMGLEPAWAHQGGAEKQAAPESRLRDGDGTAEDWTTNGTAALWLGEEEKDRTMEPSLRGRERNDSAERSGIVKAARNVAAHLVVVVEPERDGGERSAEPKERNEAEQSATVEPERNGAKCSGGTEPERTAAERSTELESGRNEAELSVVTERERNAADDLAVPVEPGRHGAEPSARPELERKATEPSAVTELERDAAEHSAVVEPGRNGAEQSKATEPKHNGAEQLGPRGFPVRGWWGQWAVYLANRKAQAAVLALSLAANAGLFAYVYVLSLDKAEYQIVG